VANTAHLKLLNRGVKRWNQWRRIHFSEKLDLSNTDLHKMDLAGINFVGVNLAGSNLKNINFKGALLRFANLSWSDCSGVDLSDADLNAACLIQVNLSHARLHRADLSRVDLRGANLRHAWGEKSFFIEANLTGANLESVNFSQAILTEANLQGANLSNANLSKTDLSFINLSGSNLTQANLSKVICIEGNMNEANLSGINLYCANCQRTTFRGACLQEADLSGGNFGESDFTKADLSLSNLKEAKMVSTLFESTKLQGVRWSKNEFDRMPEVLLEGIQWSLPAAEFSENLQRVEPPPIMGASILTEHSDDIRQDGQDGLIPDRDVLELPRISEGRILGAQRSPLTLVLSFPNPMNWIALAIALRQVSGDNATNATTLVVRTIEALTPEETILSFSVNASDLSLEELGYSLRQRYESLRVTFSQTLLDPSTTPKIEADPSAPIFSSVNQLLNLLIANLI
jgi:uncharacterized protein YjbI with pentapeptide repeats